jgi:hypothetical protein
MHAGRDVLDVIFKGTWRIALGGKEFGPYANEQEAVETTRTWAEDAEKHGHRLNVVIRGGQPSYEVFRQWRAMSGRSAACLTGSFQPVDRLVDRRVRVIWGELGTVAESDGPAHRRDLSAAAEIRDWNQPD